MQGLVTAHNISSISVKIKLVYKRNHTMGLFPIILYLLHFAAEAFMVPSLYFLHQQNMTLIPSWKALWRSFFPTSFAPHSRINWVRLLQQVFNALREGSSQNLWFTWQSLNILMGREKKKKRRKSAYLIRTSCARNFLLPLYFCLSLLRAPLY